MFRIYTDQDIREADLDLIYDFAYALVDLDKELMTDVLFFSKRKTRRRLQMFRAILPM
jgi:hypothetical protein